MIAVVIRRAAPRLAGTDLAVAEVVRVCHTTTHRGRVAALAVAGLDRSTLDPVLSYCAERRCEADNATCPGCRRATESSGSRRLMTLLRYHACITFETSDICLAGNGNATLKAHSLEAWPGAGRVRTIGSGHVACFANCATACVAPGKAVPRHRARAPHPPSYLVRPQLADNIGMTARAMANFGLEDLRLVEPRDGWPNEKARIAASGANFIIDGAQVFGGLKEALADLQWVCATSARQRDLVKPVITPEQAVAADLPPARAGTALRYPIRA